MKICAIIINKNDDDKLNLCLKSLLSQTYKNFDIIISNNKKDNSKILKDKNITYWNFSGETNSNIYVNTINKVKDLDYDWVWFLKDDIIAEVNALFFLENATHCFNNKNSFFVSVTRDENNKIINSPPISQFSENGNIQCFNSLDLSLVRVATASFSSVLINNKALKACGMPLKNHHFENNSNYLSSLVASFGAAYLVGKSKVIQKACFIDKVEGKVFKICAVVVTYNRKELLGQCIKALLSQSYKNFDILIIDNASTDGTEEYVKEINSEKIIYQNTGANIGGAGGFYYGMKKAYECNYDWIWIMDDDVIPNKNALEELLVPLKGNRKISFLASCVYSPDGKAMNTPEISKYSTNGYKFWYEKLDQGLVRLAHATFVSLLINADAIRYCGLPCKDYFIWGDDTEYTMRIIGKYGAAYLVGKSKVIHCRSNSSSLNITTENNINRIKMYYYLIRNTLINSKNYFGKKSYKNFLNQYLKLCIKIATSKCLYKKEKIKTILKAIYDYKNSRYNVEAFKNRYNIYGQEKYVISTAVNDNIQKKLIDNLNVQINHNFGKFSIFTDFEFVHYPAEKTEVFKKIDEKLILNELFVFDFTGSCQDFFSYRNAEETFNLKNKFNYDNYFIEEKHLKDLTKEYIDEYLLKFINNIKNNYEINKFVLVENYFSVNDKCDYKLYNEFLQKLYSQFKLKIPHCKTITSNEIIN